MTTAIGSYATAAAIKARTAITDAVDDTVIGLICDQINQYIETKTRRVLAPISSASYTYDGDATRRLYLPFPTNAPPIGGIRSITLVECQYYTTSGYLTVAANQYFLRQRVGMTGPYERLLFTDFAIGVFANWPRGYDTVRITATAGWAAIPDDVTELALTAATRAWHAVQAGQTDIIGTDEMGRPLVSRFFSARDLETLATYSTDIPA